MDFSEEFSFKKDYLGRLVLKGFISSIYSHEEIFKSVSQKDDSSKVTIALAHLNESHNYFLNAETLLVDNVKLFDVRNEFEDLFHRFSVYNDEVLTNVRTNHSHQWSDIEFRAFVESFKVVADLLSIDIDRYWVNLALKDED